MYFKLFNNNFLDKITNQIEIHQLARDLRIFGSGLTRAELSKVLGVSEGSIRRYESPWNTAKIPNWYLVTLRLLSGDLSYFGQAWSDTRINPTNSKMYTPHAKYEAFTPMDLNSKTAFIYQTAQRQVIKTNLENETLKKRIQAYEQDQEVLLVQIQRLQAQLENKRVVSELEKSGKVIQFRR